jgi:hypothetical protein
MNSEHLAIADQQIDIVLSRLGLLSFADPAKEGHELTRVLRPNGSFAIATWDAGSKNTLTFAAATATRAWLPAPVNAAMDRLEQLAMPGRREAWLTSAGLSEVHSELFTWTLPFPDEQSLWALVTGSAMLGAVVGGLGPDELGQARTVFLGLVADYRQPDGSYVVPYGCRMLWGSR